MSRGGSSSRKDCGEAAPVPGRDDLQRYTVQGSDFIVNKRYELQKTVGYGAYGIVCASQDTESKEKVAIKKIAKVFEDLVDGKRIVRELKLLKFMNHENVLSIKDILVPMEGKERFQDIYFVSELMDTDLHQIIRSKQKLTDEHVQYFIYQALRALKYICSAGILHRDLKPGNLLANSNCDLLICDFGLARGNEQGAEFTDYVVTRWYRPPELLLLSTSYTNAVDIWSMGCIMAELIKRKPVFPGRDYINQLKLITDVLGPPGEDDLAGIKSEEAVRYLRQMKKKDAVPLKEVVGAGATENGLDLLKKMLMFNPSKRITACEALKHSYLDQLHDPDDEPECDKTFYWEKDSKDLNAEELREGLWEEILKFHPDAK